MILSMLYGMGFEPLSERSTNTGRIDVVLEISKSIYIIELKVDNNSNIALDQKSTLNLIQTKEKKLPLLAQTFLLKNAISLIEKENLFLKMVNSYNHWDQKELKFLNCDIGNVQSHCKTILNQNNFN